MSTDPRLQEVARLLSERDDAEQRFRQAVSDLKALDKQIRSALSIYEESDPQAVPDGTGHFWIVGPRGPGSIQVQHTSGMLPHIAGQQEAA